MSIITSLVLWINRLYFTPVLLLATKARRQSARTYVPNAVIIAIWQLFGSFLIPDVWHLSPFHLLWWYPLGWCVLTIIMLLRKEVVGLG